MVFIRSTVLHYRNGASVEYPVYTLIDVPSVQDERRVLSAKGRKTSGRACENDEEW